MKKHPIRTFSKAGVTLYDFFCNSRNNSQLRFRQFFLHLIIFIVVSRRQRSQQQRSFAQITTVCFYALCGASLRLDLHRVKDKAVQRSRAVRVCVQCVLLWEKIDLWIPQKTCKEEVSLKTSVPYRDLSYTSNWSSKAPSTTQRTPPPTCETFSFPPKSDRFVGVQPHHHDGRTGEPGTIN